MLFANVLMRLRRNILVVYMLTWVLQSDKKLTGFRMVSNGATSLYRLTEETQNFET